MRGRDGPLSLSLRVLFRELILIRELSECEKEHVVCQDGTDEEGEGPKPGQYNYRARLDIDRPERYVQRKDENRE